MAYTPRPFRLALTLAAALLVAAPAVDIAAQQDRGADDNRDRTRDRRSAWNFEDGETSQNNELLKRILDRFPDADTDEDGKLDAKEARAFMQKQRERWRDRSNWRRNRLQPTHDNIDYGPHDKNHLDLYLAESENPTPLVIFFHGGQFITGDENDMGTLNVQALLSAGISVASVDYRETHLTPFPAPFEDAVQAIQFLRFYSEKLNIDPDRIAGHGEEAGGNIALYLALHDDFLDPEVLAQLEAGEIEDPRKADPDEEGSDEAPEEPSDEEEQPADDDDEEVETVEDELLEELIPWDTPGLAAMSTRLSAAVARHPIASFDPRDWAKHKLPMNDHERLMSKYLDVRYLEPLNDEAVIALVEDVSPLALISRDDPELLLMSQYEDFKLEDDTVWTIMRHHPRQSELIAKAMRVIGNKATVRYKGMKNDPGTSSIDFFIKKLK